MDKTKEFLRIFRKAEKKYGQSSKRLAGDLQGWGAPWKVLIATMLSAQSRDEVTIPIAEMLFEKYDSLEKLSKARYSSVLNLLKSMNYNRTKAKHVLETARILVHEFEGKVPDELEVLVTLPGVGRKTANLVVSECFWKPGICVDTHVHRLANVFGLVDTKSPEGTEMALRVFVPEGYWSRINRLFVLWGQEVPGQDRERLERALD